MTAVLLLGFNRPQAAGALAERLKNLDPDLEVFVSLDGPRQDVAGEAEVVAETREVLGDLLGDQLVAERLSATNEGCGLAVQSGLQWFFGQVTEGIILEDDCLPSRQFLDFAKHCLEVYREDASVSTICGVNFAPEHLTSGDPVVRSRFHHLWGWATWRRELEGFQVQDPAWRPKARGSQFFKELGPLERRDWLRWFSAAEDERPHTWDFQWVLKSWSEGKETIMPSLPLVANVGFDGGAHHSSGAPSYYFESQPRDLERWAQALDAFDWQVARRVDDLDRWISRQVYSPQLRTRILRKARRIPSRISGI